MPVQDEKAVVACCKVLGHSAEHFMLMLAVPCADVENVLVRGRGIQVEAFRDLTDSFRPERALCVCEVVISIALRAFHLFFAYQ